VLDLALGEAKARGALWGRQNSHASAWLSQRRRYLDIRSFSRRIFPESVEIVLTEDLPKISSFQYSPPRSIEKFKLSVMQTWKHQTNGQTLTITL
jgi:hypothetical protein